MTGKGKRFHNKIVLYILQILRRRTINEGTKNEKQEHRCADYSRVPILVFTSLPVVGNNVGQIHNPLRVTPFIVIPCNHLNHVVSHDKCER